MDLKFCDGDGPNQKNVSSTFSGLTLVSSNDKITIKINVKNHKKINKQKIFFFLNLNALSNGQRETNSDHEIEKKIANVHF